METRALVAAVTVTSMAVITGIIFKEEALVAARRGVRATTIGRWLYDRAYNTRQIRRSAITKSGDVLLMVNTTDLEDSDGLITSDYRPIVEGEALEGRRKVASESTFTATLVLAAKVKYGIVTRTPAWDLVVRKYLLDYCSQNYKDLRNVDKMRAISMALPLFYIPMDIELEAASVHGSDEALSRLDLIGRQIVSQTARLAPVHPHRA